MGSVKDLNKDMESKKFAPLYIFTGEEQGLISRYLSEIRVEFKDVIETSDINVVLADSKYKSLVATKKLYILKGTGLFDKKADDSFINFLVHQFKQQNNLCIFVEDKLNRTLKQTQSVSDKWIIEFKKLTESQLVEFVSSVVKQMDKKMNKDIIREFVNQCDYDYNTIVNELTKLVNFAVGKQITIDHIREVTSRSTRSVVFDLVEYVVKQQYSKALDLYDILILKKESPFVILTLIYKQLRLLYQIKLLRDEGYSVVDIADACDSKPFIIEKNFNICNFASDKLIKLLLKCNEYDWKIKTGQIQDFIAMQHLIMHSSKKEGGL